MLQALLGIANARPGAPPLKNGPPNGPFGFLVSAMRHGVTGTKLSPGILPVPLIATDCGLTAALSLTLNVPLRVPVAVGAKLTLMAQLPFTANTLPQLLV